MILKFLELFRFITLFNHLQTVYSCRAILDVVTLQLHESIVSTWAKGASQPRGLPTRPSKVLMSNISIIEPMASRLRSWKDALPG